jgi:hypothetical protein
VNFQILDHDILSVVQEKRREEKRRGETMLHVRETITLVACAVVSSTALAGTSFNTTTNDLGMGAYQLVDQFDLLFAGDTLYFDFDLDNAPDSSVALGQPDFIGTYVDPEHYTLDFGMGDLNPYFMGSELGAADSVDWRLSYVLDPGTTMLYSTIMSGSMTDNGDGTWMLEIDLGLEWPVSGMPANEFMIPEGTHTALAMADFNSFTWDGSTLAANVIPAPAAWALLLTGMIGTRRRRN